MLEKKKLWRVLGLREMNQFIEDQVKDLDLFFIKLINQSEIRLEKIGLEKGIDVFNLIDDELLNLSF